MVNGEEMHAALVAVWGHLVTSIGGRFERRGDLMLSLFPEVPVPQFNGAWVVADTDEAAAGLAPLLAEVEAAGAVPWVQLRPGHVRVHRAADAAGCVAAGTGVPGMIATPATFVDASGVDVHVALVSEDDFEETNAVAAGAFGLDVIFMAWFNRLLVGLPGVSWYTARSGGQVVSTAVAATVGDATGIFNVATPVEQRGRGYGAAVTAHAVRDAFDAGSRLAVLQSSASGHGVYRRLGFEDVVDYRLLTRRVV
jgi:predicted GNAT family acetyltransferase